MMVAPAGAENPMLENLKLRVREKRNDRYYRPAIRKPEKEGTATEADSLIGEYLHFRDEIVEDTNHFTIVFGNAGASLVARRISSAAGQR